MVRGGIEDEILLLGDWYFDGFYYHYGLFYSNDKGESIGQS